MSAPMDWVAATAYVSDEIAAMTSAIDEQFGKGFAKKNPALLGAALVAAGSVYHAETLRTYLPELGESLRDIARALPEVG